MCCEKKTQCGNSLILETWKNHKKPTQTWVFETQDCKKSGWFVSESLTFLSFQGNYAGGKHCSGACWRGVVMISLVTPRNIHDRTKQKRLSKRQRSGFQGTERWDDWRSFCKKTHERLMCQRIDFTDVYKFRGISFERFQERAVEFFTYSTAMASSDWQLTVDSDYGQGCETYVKYRKISIKRIVCSA